MHEQNGIDRGDKHREQQSENDQSIRKASFCSRNKNVYALPLNMVFKMYCFIGE